VGSAQAAIRLGNWSDWSGLARGPGRLANSPLLPRRRRPGRPRCWRWQGTRPDLPSLAEPCGSAASRRCLERRRGRAHFPACLVEESHGSGGLTPLAHRLVLNPSLVRNGPKLMGKAGEWPYLWQNRRELHPVVVVRTPACRHLSLIQPPLKGGPYVWGNLLHGNVCATSVADTAPSWADAGDSATALGRLAS
jgi:hypothetical protein